MSKAASGPAASPEPLERIFVRSPRMVGREVAGEFILVPLVGRGADLDSIFSLNRVAAFVWERIDGKATGRDIVGAMVERFEVDLAAATADYGRFVEQLETIGAITDRNA